MKVNISKNNIISSVTIFFQEHKNNTRGHLIGTSVMGGQQLDPTTSIRNYYEYIILTQ